MTETATATEPNTSKKGVWGWMFFDWAAQPFFTVMTTFIFGPYVVSRMVSDPDAGQAAWAGANPWASGAQCPPLISDSRARVSPYPNVRKKGSAEGVGT